ncbi:MAG: HAMP domain-containing sensor histidine kinase [Clostridium sp.]|uniref:sensor histidine kinase n=1 Tax=Clostridium sp. TaxID=1506 RepID=UPI0029156B56|nr:HAMP domain-containing sensor histidine kinase [Clostridium sp.]MDU7251551.1 HAMP domain-containing sensor histidine kinase [Clostridium sp.]
MGKLTGKLIRNFMTIISIVIVISLIFISMLLPYIYNNMQFKDLKAVSNEIYKSLNNYDNYEDEISKYEIDFIILSKNGEDKIFTSGTLPGKGMLKNINIDTLSQKGKYAMHKGASEFSYYKNKTDLGDIIVFKNNRLSSQFIKATYIVLISIFFLATFISIPIVSFLGKKLTNPIIKLEKASLDITQGNFNIDVDNIKTKDEIEELSKSIKIMAKELENKNIMQKNFIANVSHDFKTPLSVIRNYSEAIYDNIIDENEKTDYAKEIINEVDRLNGLVMDIMQLSKLQRGKDLLKKEYFLVDDFLFSFKDVFKIPLNKKNIKLLIRVTDKNMKILGDKSYLYRVIYNFIDNGIKFTNEGGKIELGADIVEDNVKIYVKDNGVGIDEKYLENIWQRYYKDKKSGGVGLGLAICGEILNMHDFKYGVKSEKNIGTEFYFFTKFNY